MPHPLLDAAHTCAATLRRRRRLDPRRLVGPGERVVKVNLGSGLCVAPRWINLDTNLTEYLAKLPIPLLRRIYRISDSRQWYSEETYLAALKEHVFIHHDVVNGLPFPDESVDYIYSSHLLEHMYIEDGERLLREANRVLRKGGLVRICVPDLEYALSLYVAGHKDSCLDLLFTHPKASRFARHRYMYDFELLKRALERAAFRDVTRRSYREGRTPDLELLDNRPEETLYVEATK